MDGKDGNGLKVENFGPNFSSFNEMPAKPTEKLLWLVLRCEICSSYLYSSILCMSKGTKN